MQRGREEVAGGGGGEEGQRGQGRGESQWKTGGSAAREVAGRCRPTRLACKARRNARGRGGRSGVWERRIERAGRGRSREGGRGGVTCDNFEPLALFGDNQSLLAEVLLQSIASALLCQSHGNQISTHLLQQSLCSSMQHPPAASCSFIPQQAWAGTKALSRSPPASIDSNFNSRITWIVVQGVYTALEGKANIEDVNKALFDVSGCTRGEGAGRRLGGMGGLDAQVDALRYTS